MAALVPDKDTKSNGRNYTTPRDATQLIGHRGEHWTAWSDCHGANPGPVYCADRTIAADCGNRQNPEDRRLPPATADPHGTNNMGRVHIHAQIALGSPRQTTSPSDFAHVVRPTAASAAARHTCRHAPLGAFAELSRQLLSWSHLRNS
jgi:hypothetical protein